MYYHIGLDFLENYFYRLNPWKILELSHTSGCSIHWKCLRVPISGGILPASRLFDRSRVCKFNIKLNHAVIFPFNLLLEILSVLSCFPDIFPFGISPYSEFWSSWMLLTELKLVSSLGRDPCSLILLAQKLTIFFTCPICGMQR